MSSSSESSSLVAGVDLMDTVEWCGPPDALDEPFDLYIALCASVNCGGLISNASLRLGDGFWPVRAFLDGEGPSDRITSESGEDSGGRRIGVGVAMGIACEEGAFGVGVDRRSW